MSKEVEATESRTEREDELREAAQELTAERRATNTEDERASAATPAAVEDRGSGDEKQDEKQDDERPRKQAETAEEQRASLFDEDRAADLRAQWSAVQGRFVDDPPAAVKAADALVQEVVGLLTSQFAAERSRLDSQWGRDEKVSTEDLRVALRRYRAFFERLLSV
jgi:hypothetical protein